MDIRRIGSKVAKWDTNVGAYNSMHLELLELQQIKRLSRQVENIMHEDAAEAEIVPIDVVEEVVTTEGVVIQHEVDSQEDQSTEYRESEESQEDDVCEGHMIHEGNEPNDDKASATDSYDSSDDDSSDDITLSDDNHLSDGHIIIDTGVGEDEVCKGHLIGEGDESNEALITDSCNSSEGIYLSEEYTGYEDSTDDDHLGDGGIIKTDVGVAKVNMMGKVDNADEEEEGYEGDEDESGFNDKNDLHFGLKTKRRKLMKGCIKKYKTKESA